MGDARSVFDCRSFACRVCDQSLEKARNHVGSIRKQVGFAGSPRTGEGNGAEGDRRMTSISLIIFIATPAVNVWAVLGACFALLVAVVLFVFFIQPDASDLAPHRSKLDQLLERRDTIYDNLRDLRFEYRAGKYSDSDYETMKNAMEIEVALMLAEIDRATDSITKRPRGPKPAQRGAH